MKTLEGKTEIADKNNLYSNHLINIFQYQYQALQLYKLGGKNEKLQPQIHIFPVLNFMTQHLTPSGSVDSVFSPPQTS
jgi:hypothetical protein